MSNFNAGMRAIAICLRIRNEDLSNYFEQLENSRYSRSRVKSMFYGPSNSKYRHATEEDFRNFLKSIHIKHFNDGSKLEIFNNSIELDDWAVKILGDLIPPILRLVVIEIIRFGSDDFDSKSFLYSNQLQLFCIGYLACEHKEMGFDGQRDFAIERLLGMFLGVYLSRVKDNTLFYESDFESLCGQIKSNMV